jgi:GntR family transcriptional repressor for pyruvate dehydrogenase complex
MALKVVEKQSVGDVVFDQMMHALSTKEWSPGAKIPGENELAKSMGVSRVTVRGALQKLAALGLVESKQGEGTFVSEISGAQGMNAVFPTMILGKGSAMEMLEFREAFECGSAAIAAKHADKGDIAKLQEAIDRMQREDLTIEQRRRSDADFHVILGEATKNPIILKVYDI